MKKNTEIESTGIIILKVIDKILKGSRNNE